MIKQIHTSHSQQGATLIAVLLVLLLVMIVGVVAFKRSSTDLQVATAAQIDKLTFQANSVAFSKIEEASRADASNVTSLAGYMTRAGQPVNAEVTLCLNPKASLLFDTTKISEKNALGQALAGRSAGYCDVGQANYYTNEGRVITQLTFKKIQEVAADCAFCGEVAGTGGKGLELNADSQGLCVPFEGHAVSLIPTYSNASDSNINACLKKSIDGSDSISACLAGLGVPHNIQTQIYRAEPKDAKCLS